MSPSVYVALCGLLKEALDDAGDAAPLLRQAAAEMSAASALDQLPEDAAKQAAAILEMAREAATQKSAA